MLQRAGQASATQKDLGDEAGHLLDVARKLQKKNLKSNINLIYTYGIYD